ncbi:galectin-related protein-like isoform X2 [Ranitomeya variabilis]|uniref:galectin-related protein-like isoform X2 n=1 Tax=Ranitomeya variabilis TaxID=490064 RepID=UPI00405702E9
MCLRTGRSQPALLAVLWIADAEAFSKEGEKYVGDIKGGMKPAMKITIMGTVDIRPKSFTVSLLCRPNDLEEDVALLLTVNFQDRSIIRNAKFAGIWGAEERKIPYFPFTAGENFKMEIVCQHRQMQVFLDGQRLCDFTHRVPQLKAVTGLRVTGDIKLTKVA